MTSTLPPLVQALSGALGSVVANTTSYPLDLACTRLQTAEPSKKQGIIAMLETLRRIKNNRGILGLYDGLETDTAATLISNFFYFYAYSFLRSLTIRKKIVQISQTSNVITTVSAFEEIGLGFLAGVASRAISTPLSLITVRLQEEQQALIDAHIQQADPTASGSIGRVVRHIYAENGLTGFWKGFKTTILLCLNPSLTLFLFQAFRRVFLRGQSRENPSARQAFIGAAFSNVIAVTVLYSFILAKTRLQSARKDFSNKATRGPTSMCGVWRTAYAQNGIDGVYQGLQAQLVKGFLNQGLTMMTKQRLERLVVALYLYRFHSSGKSLS
ncbi:hypothetical protein M0805_009085 [Coniferiporia weirii]|nr:hypothetical protein M0805_009085 [Coniferiporia weirii]